MNSRERINAALRREPVDRVPIDFGGSGATGINIYSYMDAKRFLGMPEAILTVSEVLAQLAEIEPAMIEAMGSDVVCLWRQAPSLGMRVDGYKMGTLFDGVTQAYIPNAFNIKVAPNGDKSYYKPLDDHTHPYKTSVGKEYDVGVEVARCPAGQKAFCRVYNPLKDITTVEELKEWSYPEMDQKELDDIAARAKRLYETTDKAICGVFGALIFETGQLYWGAQNFYCNLIDEETEDMMACFLEERTDVLIKDIGKYLSVCGKYISCIQFWDDLGSQESLLISPALYREKIKPQHKRIFDYIHENYPEVKILFHSCGAISELIPDFIEIGVDALNPVQISAKGMNPEKLVREFGQDITFWGGGVDTQTTLCRKTPAEVEAEVKKNLDAFTKGAGYIFTQVHNVEATVSGENLVAAFLTAKNYKL